MTSNPPAGSPEGQVPGAPAAAICKRPGCGNTLNAGGFSCLTGCG